MTETTNPFTRLASIDVSKHIERKQNLSYLSWAWAVDQLMRADPQANWEFHQPAMYGETMMVSCTVTAFGKAVRMHLPVMDHRNQAVKNPDAFVVNKNMMRCLVKAIACHGLGLYIYAGEDLPLDDDGNAVSKPTERPAAKVEAMPATTLTTMDDDELDACCIALQECDDLKSLMGIFGAAYKRASTDAQTILKSVYDRRKHQLTTTKESA